MDKGHMAHRGLSCLNGSVVVYFAVLERVIRFAVSLICLNTQVVMLYVKYLSIAFIKRPYLLSYSISDTSFMSPYARTVSRTLSRVLVTYKTGFGFDDWIYCTLYIHTTRDYRQYSAIADLHTLLFTAAHTLESSAFTSRILATDS
jgi:hypothetical protein